MCIFHLKQLTVGLLEDTFSFDICWKDEFLVIISCLQTCLWLNNLFFVGIISLLLFLFFRVLQIVRNMSTGSSLSLRSICTSTLFVCKNSNTISPPCCVIPQHRKYNLFNQKSFFNIDVNCRKPTSPNLWFLSSISTCRPPS